MMVNNRNANFRGEVRKLRAKVNEIVAPTPIVAPATIIFDIGEYCTFILCC